MDSLGGSLFSVVAIGLVAVFVFESVKAESKRNRQLCICGHRYYGPKHLGHVRPMDYDCDSYIAGAEFKAYKCRQCTCRRFINKGEQWIK